MSDLCKATFVLGIEIVSDRSCRSLRLSQRSHISCRSRELTCHNCSASKAPIIKEDKYSISQSLKTDIEMTQ